MPKASGDVSIFIITEPAGCRFRRLRIFGDLVATGVTVLFGRQSHPESREGHTCG